MTREYTHPKLAGVWSTPARVSSFESFTIKANSLTEVGDYVLAYNNIPLIYFLTETRPYLRNIWPTLNGRSGVPKLFEAVKEKPLPKYIFRAITNTQGSQWGHGAVVPPHNSIHFEGLKVIDAWVSRNGYEVIWRNKDFLILGKAQ